MDSFEMAVILGESGITAPDKCTECPRLGALASTLSIAKENKQFIATSSDEDVLTANIHSQLSEQMRHMIPHATEEEIAATASRSVADFLGSDQYPEFLKNAGSHLAEEDAKIEATLGEITTLLANCPPEGCGLDE